MCWPAIKGGVNLYRKVGFEWWFSEERVLAVGGAELALI